MYECLGAYTCWLFFFFLEFFQNFTFVISFHVKTCDRGVQRGGFWRQNYTLPCRPTHFEAPKNYRKIFFMLAILFSKLSTPGKLLAPPPQVKCENSWGVKEFTWGGKKKSYRLR